MINLFFLKISPIFVEKYYYAKEYIKTCHMIDNEIDEIYN